jgi:hypothetical protein
MYAINEARKREATGDAILCTPPAPVIQSRIFVFHADRKMEWK